MGVLEGVNNIHDVRGRIFGMHILAIRTRPFPLVRCELLRELAR